MTKMSNDQKFLLGAAALFAVLVLTSLFVNAGQGPDAWLQEWTDWAAKYVALVVTAQSVVKIADGVAVRLKGAARDG